jgi:membrane-associated phospholipid phosphatase
MADWIQSGEVLDLESAASGERLQRLARLISNLLSPAALAVPALLLGVYASHEPGAWRFALLYVLVGVLVPLADLAWCLRTGRISDFHLSKRGERRRPFLVGTLATTAAVLLFHALGAPPVLMAMAQATLLQSVVLFAITLFWQISVHMATIASLVTFMLAAFGAEATPFVLLVPLVAWARLYLGRHNLPQVVAGTIVGVTAMLVCLAGVLY